MFYLNMNCLARAFVDMKWSISFPESNLELAFCFEESQEREVPHHIDTSNICSFLLLLITMIIIIIIIIIINKTTF